MHKSKWGPGALMFAPDKGDGGQVPPPEPPETAAQDAGQGDGQPAATVAGKVDELPDWARSLISELRAENAGHRTAKKKAEEEAEKAKEERLAQEKRFEELAEQRKARIEELEPAHASLAERTTKLEAMINAQLEAEVKDWPDEVKALDPGKDADILTRLDWVQKSRALAAKLGNTTPVPGNGRKPQPTAQARQHDTDQSIRQVHSQWARSQF